MKFYQSNFHNSRFLLDVQNVFLKKLIMPPASLKGVNSITVNKFSQLALDNNVKVN